MRRFVSGTHSLARMTMKVRSRLFTASDFPQLVTVIAAGFSHSALTAQARAHGITGDPGKVNGITKPDRANVFVDTLLERPWPAGDEALLDLLSNAEEDGFSNEAWIKARARVWKALDAKSDLVVYEDGAWLLLGTKEETNDHTEQVSAALGESSPSRSFTSAPNNESSAPVVLESSSLPPAKQDGPPRVFVVQGRDQNAADQVLHFLRGVHLIPLEWEEVKDACELHATTMDIVRKGLEMAKVIVVVLSGDDLAMLQTTLQKDEDSEQERHPTPQPRQNVLLEAGMALGMAREQTVLVRTNKLREISDLNGINWITMKGTEDARLGFTNALKKALRAAGVADPLPHVPHMWNKNALGEFSASSR